MRWYLDLGFVGLRLVGKVWQSPPVDDIPKGSIRPASPWVAVGMAVTWADVDLGKTHPTRSEAMQAVANWWADFSKTAPGPKPLSSFEGGK